MDLATELATICVLAKEAADDPLAVREQFEGAARKEQLLRTHAERLRALAKRRAAREDESAGGYVQTGLERMLPIPYTSTEALLRAPAVGLGALLGYQHGGTYEPIDPGDLKRTFTPAGDSGASKGKGKGAPAPVAGTPGTPKTPPSTPLELRLEELRAQKMPNVGSAELSKLLQKLRLESGAALSGALAGDRRIPDYPTTIDKMRTAWKDRTLDVSKAQHAQLRSEIEKVLGPIGGVRQEVKNVIRQTPMKVGPIKELIPKINWHGVGGGLLGAGIGSAISGLPFAVRALWQKSQGGEGAVRARGEAQEATEQAEDLAAKRDRLLARLKALKERRDPEGIELPVKAARLTSGPGGFVRKPMPAGLLPVVPQGISLGPGGRASISPGTPQPKQGRSPEAIRQSEARIRAAMKGKDPLDIQKVLNAYYARQGIGSPLPGKNRISGQFGI
jgi:hypothetical protein